MKWILIYDTLTTSLLQTRPQNNSSKKTQCTFVVRSKRLYWSRFKNSRKDKIPLKESCSVNSVLGEVDESKRLCGERVRG